MGLRSGALWRPADFSVYRYLRNPHGALAPSSPRASAPRARTFYLLHGSILSEKRATTKPGGFRLRSQRVAFRQHLLVEISRHLDDRNKNLFADPATGLERSFTFSVKVVKMATPVAHLEGDLIDAKRQHSDNHRPKQSKVFSQHTQTLQARQLAAHRHDHSPGGIGFQQPRLTPEFPRIFPN